MRKWFRVTAALLLLVILLTGLTAAAAKRELVLWEGSWLCQDIPGEDQAYRLEREFEALHPDVDVKVVSVAWDGMLEKFILASQTGNLPDMLCSESFLGWTQLFASYGHYMDLTELMNQIGADTFFPGVMEGSMYQGKFYSIPYRNSTRIFVYNKDMFEAAGLDPNSPPETWAQLLEYAQKLTKDTNGDGTTDQWGFDYPAARFTTVAPEYLRCVMRSYGADILSADMKTCIIDSPESISAIRFWTDLVTKYKVVSPECISYSDDDDWQAFGAGLTAMAMVGPWAVETYTLTNKDLNFGVATLPSTTPGQPGEFGLVHMGWMVNGDTKVKDDVYNLIKYALQPEVDAWFTDDTPAVRGSWSSPAFTDRYSPDAIATMVRQMDYTISSILLIPVGPQIAREVNVAVQRIILGMDVETVVAEAKGVIDELLKETAE